MTTKPSMECPSCGARSSGRFCNYCGTATQVVATASSGGAGTTVKNDPVLADDPAATAAARSAQPDGTIPLTRSDPDTTGPFRLVDCVGTGGMGVVYRGFDASGRWAAIKVIRPELAPNPEFRTRLAREVELLKRVTGPRTAGFLAADPVAAPPWVATELIDGPTLGEAVAARGPFTIEQAAWLGRGLAEAMIVLHAVGVIHRDLKPSNVMLSSRGPVMIDFGISRAVDETHTLTSALLGTPAYMSPEQVLGQEITESSDTFAWASTVAFAASGRSLFGSGRPEAVTYRVVNEAPALPPLGRLEPLVRRSLSKDPADRPSMREIVRTIGAVHNYNDEFAEVAAKPWPQMPSTAQASPGPIPVAAASPAMASSTASDTHRRGPGWVLAGVTTVLAVAAVGFTVWLANRPSNTTGDRTAASVTTEAPASEATTASSAPTTPAPATAEPVEAETSIVPAPPGESAAPMPTAIRGWKPDGPLQTGTTRVFSGEWVRAWEYEQFAGSTNACYPGYWTFRWRSQLDSPEVIATVAPNALEDPYLTPEERDGHLEEDLNSVTPAAAGYLSGFICESPVFTYLDGPETTSTLTDVVFEAQRWLPAV